MDGTLARSIGGNLFTRGLNTRPDNLLYYYNIVIFVILPYNMIVWVESNFPCFL